MRLSITLSQNPSTPYIEDYFADILTDSGELIGKRAFTLIKIQEMLDDEAGLLENFNDCTDFAYASAVFGEDFLMGKTTDMTELAVRLDTKGNFNILVLKCLEVLPEFRGKGCGKEADRKVCEYMAGRYGLAIKKASPLQYGDFVLYSDPVWVRRMGYPDMQGDRKKDTDSLIRKYESWGYTRIGDTAFLYKEL